MTGTEQHAPRGTAGRGTNWHRGPCAGYAGAVRRCTKRHCRLWALPGTRAVHGPRELRVDDISAPPAARPFVDRGPEELRDSERTYASTHAYLGTAGRGTRKGTVGCERAGGAA